MISYDKNAENRMTVPNPICSEYHQDKSAFSIITIQYSSNAL